jgi:hypothetical protein
MIYIAGDKHGLKAIEYAEAYLKKRKIAFVNLGVQKKGKIFPLKR